VEYSHKQAEQVIKAKLIVELRDDGRVYVTGNLKETAICLAMLDEAKEAVKDYKKTKIFIPTKEILKKLGTTSI
jgi:hypothetical protein